MLEARRNCNVGVDLHEEVAANDHRLEFGMIDVAGMMACPRHLASENSGVISDGISAGNGKRPMEWWSDGVMTNRRAVFPNRSDTVAGKIADSRRIGGQADACATLSFRG